MDSHLDLTLMLEAQKRGQHLTMDGTLVNCTSVDCQADLERRISDAVHTRDLATTRSDERIYYNGVLRVLRRKLRDVKKDLQQEGANDRVARSKATSNSARMLRLAGIF